MRLTGGCQCGAVRYAFTQPMASSGLCYCRMCQKASGGPFMVFGKVWIDDLTWTRGTPARFRSSSIATRGFCSACGTPLFYQDATDRIDLTLGSLDDPCMVAPDHAVGIESCLPWTAQIAALPAKTTGQSMGSDTLCASVPYQHPDHDS